MIFCNAWNEIALMEYLPNGTVLGSVTPQTGWLLAQQDPLGGWGFFVPLLLMLVLFWFLLIRPAQKRERERQEMLASIRKHDEVITAGGIIGRVVGIQEKSEGIAGGEDVLRIEVDDGTHLRVLRSMIVKVKHKDETAGEVKKS
ncbi:MAG: preprotein translocase subunit YajC [Gemmatales bacterium]|nr:preprotein translocase subunit YajC [Gemmatales bacterium]MDW8221317.1 preprotein translocase subunit YajC [Gemmatales bacterium]